MRRTIPYLSIQPTLPPCRLFQNAQLSSHNMLARKTLGAVHSLFGLPDRESATQQNPGEDHTFQHHRYGRLHCTWK